MKNALILVTLLTVAACATQDEQQIDASLTTNDSLTTPSPSANVPRTIIPDVFTDSAGMQTFNARKAFDLTGDGIPETLVVRAAGPSFDSADVSLVILSTGEDTLYVDRWDTQHYFAYEYRKDFTDSAATAKVVRHLQRLLSDSAFHPDGPSPQLKNSIPGGMEDAIRYDLKADAVRRKNSLPAAAPITPALHAQMESMPVSAAAIDSLVQELDSAPTFTYFAGGEVTYAIAWSDVKKRFVRIFACC